MAIDLPRGVAIEQGFVVQQLDCGTIREAWFFIDMHRAPLTSDEIATVLDAAEHRMPTRHNRATKGGASGARHSPQPTHEP